MITPFRILLMLSWGAVVLVSAAEKAPADDVVAVRAELEAMLKTDQEQRLAMVKLEKEKGPNAPEKTELWKKQNEADAYNIKRLEEIIAVHGWPKRSVFGPNAAGAAFLIVQHADISYQKKYLPLARAAVAANEMAGSSLALLEDRVLLREGGKQVYGSQVRRNSNDEWEPLPIEDEEHVDERRARVGLRPLADYLGGFAERSGGKVPAKYAKAPDAGAAPAGAALPAASGPDPKSAPK
jgi:hypothetical protein